MAVRYWAKKFQNIILTGLPATGKAAFGRTYAYHSGRTFLDFQRHIENQTQKSTAELLRQQGPEGYAKLEEKYLKNLQRQQQTVIVLGGGIAGQPAVWEELIQPLGLGVVLKTPLPVLVKRIWNHISNGEKLSKKYPMFLEAASIEDVEQILTQMSQDREAGYSQAAVCLEADFYSLDNLKIQLALWEKHPVHMGLISREQKQSA
jgi:shikimate kinase